jgi:hypothetical protein
VNAIDIAVLIVLGVFYVVGAVFFAALVMSGAGEGSFKWYQILFWPITVVVAVIKGMQ